MAWTKSQYALVIRAIGTVESNLKYDAINYNDPITVGVAQWFGTRAAGLLKRIKSQKPAAWTGVQSAFNATLDRYSANSSYWNTYYLSSAAGESLRGVLNNAKDIQDAQFSDDIDSYLTVGRNWGLDPDNNFKAVAFWATVYHQSPLQSRNILQKVGTSPTLDEIYRATLNNPVVGAYRTRQDTVYRIIKAGVTSGDNGGGETDNEPLPDQEFEIAGGSIKRISSEGDMLVVHTTAGNILAYPSIANQWIPRKNEIGGGKIIVPGDPGDPGDGGDDGGSGGSGKWSNPVDNQRCTNRFGALSYTPFHSGIDLGAITPGVPGDPIRAPYDGKIVRRGLHGQVLYANSGRGYILDIGTHNGDRMYVYYGHLWQQLVDQGENVTSGQKIATMGGTGANDSNSDFAVHLHIVVFKNATINPNGPTTVPIANFLDPEKYFQSKGLLKNMNTCPYN